MTPPSPDVHGTPGEIYDRHRVPAIFGRWAPDLVELASPRAGERVLDVACGSGVVTRLLPPRVGACGAGRRLRPQRPSQEGRTPCQG